MDKRYAIVTASDRKYGDFLIEHWLESLAANADLSETDVVILDYGLSAAQRYYLEGHGALLWPGVRDGHVTAIRYRELASFLEEHPRCEQALFCDSGDIVFQGDPCKLFGGDQDSYRAVAEDYKPLFSVFIGPEFFSPPDRRRLMECFICNPMLNGGLVVAPRDKMIALAREILGTIKDKSKFGPDQIVLNGVLHRDGYVSLDPIYNYVVATAEEGVRIKDGRFFTGQGREPVVVHNAGNVGVLRPVENFGYGKDRNVLKEDVYNALHGLYQSTEGLFKTQELFIDSRRRFKAQVQQLMKDLLPPKRRRAELGGDE